MKTRHLRIRVVSVALPLLLLLLATGCGTVTFPAGDPGYLPMSRGVRWLYESHAEVCRAGGGVATNDTLVSCEVLETAARGGVSAARLSGFPLQLDVWTEGTNLASEVLLVCIPVSQYHLLDTNELARFRDPRDSLLSVVDESSLILDCPLAAGKRFGDVGQLARPDCYYCWHVESEEAIRLRGIRGISPWRVHRAYRLVYRTLPDEQRVLFVPGVGIVEYAYHHNGTPCDVRLRLKSFYRPRPPPLTP